MIRLRLPKKDSATWRAGITFLQSALGFLVLLNTNQDLMKLIADHYPWLLPGVGAAAAIASFLLNLMRGDVRNY